MAFTIGYNLKLTLFGASHNSCVGVTIAGLKPGIKIDFAYVAKELQKRSWTLGFADLRKEADTYEVVSGYFREHTDGSPLTIIIQNKDMDSGSYQEFLLRASHADYSAFVKYGPFRDFRGGGIFSGRMTAPLVFAGAICEKILAANGIYIASHIQRIGAVKDAEFAAGPELLAQIKELNASFFPVIDKNVQTQFMDLIHNAKAASDSVGGVVETVVLNLPAGIGEPFFDSLESYLAQLLFSVPGVKGVEFGDGFHFADLRGSEALDEYFFEDHIQTKANHNGGINGGVSNGMPVVLKTVFKPTPSVSQTEATVDLKTLANVKHRFTGRFDPTLVVKGSAVINAVVAFGLLDLFLSEFGWDKLKV